MHSKGVIPYEYLTLRRKPHDRNFIRLDKTPECDGRTDRPTDGQTDRQNRSSYYSGLHCEQCARAVKIVLLMTTVLT